MTQADQAKTSLAAVGISHGPVIAALHGICFDGTVDAAWDDKAVTELLAMPGAFAFVASQRGQPIGFVLARQAADEGEIINIGIVPDARRQGIAGLLLDAVIEKVACDGGQQIFLEVAADNAAALAVYSGRNFQICGRRAGYYRRPDGVVDARILVRQIGSGK